MIACIAVMLFMSLPTSTCSQYYYTEGNSSRYSAGVMEATVHVRQHELNQLPLYTNGYDGYVATRDCSHIGNVVLARPTGTKRWRYFLVADCARRDDGDGTRSWMTENNILLELDYPTAVSWKSLDGGIRIDVIFDCSPYCNLLIKENTNNATHTTTHTWMARISNQTPEWHLHESGIGAMAVGSKSYKTWNQNSLTLRKRLFAASVAHRHREYQGTEGAFVVQLFR